MQILWYVAFAEKLAKNLDFSDNEVHTNVLLQGFTYFHIWKAM